MKKKIMKQMFTFAATALACTAILIVSPNPDLSDPESTGNELVIENPIEEEDGGKGTEIKSQNDSDFKEEKKE